MTRWKQYLEDPEQFERAFRLFDFPMYYFAAIQKRNQVNLGRKLDRIGLTPLDWRILAALQENGAMTINDLAEITVFDRFKVSRGVNDLMKQELVLPDPSARDGRKRRLVLSESGQEKYKEAFALAARVYLANFEGLSDDEFDELMRLVRRIKDNVYRIEEY